MPISSAPGKQSREGHGKLKASLIYIVLQRSVKLQESLSQTNSINKKIKNKFQTHPKSKIPRRNKHAITVLLIADNSNSEDSRSHARFLKF